MNQIINHPIYQSAMEELNKWESDRTYCKHGLTHQLDVGRIAYIISLEKGLGIKKDIIYAIALLHDIGKYLQYEKQLPHNETSATMAEPILKDCGYDQDEIHQIVQAIFHHRKKSMGINQLDKIIYQADKLSRNCFTCREEDSCNWSDDKKNKGLTW
jgi:uncharacterized protein